jgi:hypothetical protein
LPRYRDAAPAGGASGLNIAFSHLAFNETHSRSIASVENIAAKIRAVTAAAAANNRRAVVRLSIRSSAMTCSLRRFAPLPDGRRLVTGLSLAE